MKRTLTLLTSVLALWLLSSAAQAQWQDGNLAVRTNGTIFQSGDQLKVEILALNEINEAFYTQVSYKFTETVKVKDDDGKDKTEKQERTRARQPGPVLQSMEKYRSLLLDDTFHFGESNPTGRYLIEVSVFRAYGKDRLTTVRASVFFQNVDYSCKSCAPFLGSLKRANTAQWLTFDGIFAESGRYTVLLLDKGQVVKQIITNIYPNGPRELNIISDALDGTAGRTFDILIHDHDRNISSTIARVTIPSTS